MVANIARTDNFSNMAKYAHYDSSASSCASSSSLSAESLSTAATSQQPPTSRLGPISSFGESSPRAFTSESDRPSQAKASTINLPLELPPSPRPLIDVDCTTLIVDHELEGIPIGYIIAKMRTLGPALLDFATHTVLDIPQNPQLPSYIWTKPTKSSLLPPRNEDDATTASMQPCTPYESTPMTSPSHILAVRAHDAHQTLLVPVHGLLFAARSASLSVLSSSPEEQPRFPHHPALPSTHSPITSDEGDGRIALPVVELNLPSATAFPLLLTFIYIRSPAVLLSSLLPKPSETPSDHFLSPPSATGLAQALRSSPSNLLLNRISLVHALWQDVVALDIEDELLWSSMRFAWSVLVGAMRLRKLDDEGL